MEETSIKPDAHMPLYGNDLFAACAGFSDSQIVAYLRALWHYWSHTHCEGLPDREDYLMRVCASDPVDWQTIKPAVFDNHRFFILEGGVWHQRRCRDEYTKTVRAYAAKCEAAGRARKAKPANPISKLVANPVNNTGNNTVNAFKSESEQEPSIGTCGNGAAVELPVNFPKTEKEAIERAAMAGVLDGVAKKAYNAAMSRGGRDAKDIPIRDWASHVKACDAYDRDRTARQQQNKNGKGIRGERDEQIVIPNFMERADL